MPKLARLPAWVWCILAAVFPIATVILACSRSDIPLVSALKFAGLEVAVNVLPGVLVWRLLRGRCTSLWEDVPLGAALGHTISLASYILFSLVDLRAFAWTVSAAILVAMVTNEQLQWVWRTPASRRAPLHYVWGMTAVLCFGTAWFVRFQNWNPISGEDRNYQLTDAPYVLSLAAELKHHFPPQIPFLRGEPLSYAWFAFGDAANASWTTGLELDLLVFRLLPLLYLLLTLAAFAAVTRRISGSSVVGLVSVAVTGAISLTSPLGWINDTTIWVTNSNLLSVYNWATSPTQAFALLLSMPLVLLIIETLREPPGTAHLGRLALIAALSLALMGAQLAFLLVLGAGILFAVLQWAFVRRLHLVGLALCVFLLALLALAQAYLFQGEREGLVLSPGQLFSRFTDDFGFAVDDTRLFPWLFVSVVLLLGWLGPCIGALGLWRNRDVRADVAIGFIVGMTVASVVLATFFTHPDLSQLWFLRAALPWATFLGVWGLAWLTVSEALPARRMLGGVTAAVAAGALITLVPGGGRGSSGLSLFQLLSPYLLAALLVIAIAVLTSTPGDSFRPQLFAALPLVICALLVGCGLAGTAKLWHGQQARFVAAGEPAIPSGGIDAARFVRKQSGPSELIATNAHCRTPTSEVCNTMNHWIAAWSERRVLIEGWGYVPRTLRGATTMSEALSKPFWDEQLLRTNDVLFTRPSQTAYTRLASTTGVDWLVVDGRFPARERRLNKLFPEHHRFGQVVVYDLRDDTRSP